MVENIIGKGVNNMSENYYKELARFQKENGIVVDENLMLRKLYEENIKYKELIDKAIEYINSKHNWYGDEEEDNEDYLFELEDFEELLNILKGSDNNE